MGVRHRWYHRYLLGLEWFGYLLSRYLLRDCPLPLHVLPDCDHRRVLRCDLLVPEDVWPDALRDARQDSLLGHHRFVQLRVHSAVPLGDGWSAPSYLELQRVS